MGMHEMPDYKFKKGDRVRLTKSGECNYTDKGQLLVGDIGIVNEDYSSIPFVAWDRLDVTWAVVQTELEPAPLFAVGDKVRVVNNDSDRPDYTGRRGEVVEVGSELTVRLDDDGVELFFTSSELAVAASNSNAYSSCAAAEVDNLREEYGPAVARQPQGLRIEAGKFYRTRDGRKVGPAMTNYIDADFAPFSVDGWNHDADGTCTNLGGINRRDLIAEWVDEPAAVVGAPTFKVGDFLTKDPSFGWKRDGYKVTKIEGGKVFLDSGTGTGHQTVYDINDDEWIVVSTATASRPAIVALIEDGQPKPATLPFVHGSADEATKEADRLAYANKGREFGVYELVDTRKVAAPVYDHEWQRLASAGRKIDAIKELRTLTGMTLTCTKDAVEHWLDWN